jgi:hypothetical protein
MPEGSDKPMIVLPGPASKTPPAEEGPERRSTPRFSFTAAADVRELRSQTRVTGRSSDLSLGGCYIDTISPFPVGTVVRVRFERELHKFEAMAVVTYALQSMGMGVAFTSIAPEDVAVLKAWMEEMSGEQPPATEIGTSDPQSGKLPTIMNSQQVLNELISLMVRKELITEIEGLDLLRQLFR